jgi:hypothetical protein
MWQDQEIDNGKNKEIGNGKIIIPSAYSSWNESFYGM